MQIGAPKTSRRYHFVALREGLPLIAAAR